MFGEVFVVVERGMKRSEGIVMMQEALIELIPIYITELQKQWRYWAEARDIILYSFSPGLKPGATDENVIVECPEG